MTKMFLLVYDRADGRLLECREVDPTGALAERFRTEQRLAGNPNLEVAVLGAESFEALKRTHARYFSSARDLLAEAL